MPSPNLFFLLMRILIPLATAVCIGLAALYLWVQFTFSYRKKNTAKTAGVLREADCKRNVTRHGLRGRSYFIKHLTKTRYVYTVNGVEYSIRGEHYGTKRQTPRFVPVIYLKRFPRFAYKDEIGFGDIRYGIRGSLLLIWSLPLLLLTVGILTNKFF